LRNLLDQRFALKDVPNKRLIELCNHFESLPPDITVANRQEFIKKWMIGLESFLERCSSKTELAIKVALGNLGQFVKRDVAHYWCELQRNGGKPLAHGMLDLLEVWDFAQDLNKKPEVYELEEEDAL